MTRVEKVDAITTQEVKKQKKQEETKKADTELQTLLGNKDAQKARREELIDDYLGLGLTKRQAKKAAKNQVKNEVTQEKVDRTIVYFDKDEYEKNKDKDEAAGFIPEYVKNKKVREMVEKHPERFYLTVTDENDNDKLILDENGNKIFSSDKYKLTMREFTGLDYKLNLDERKAGARAFGVKKRHMKKAVKYGNFEYERDLTPLYKTGAVIGSLGLGALIGSSVGANFNSNVYGIHADGSKELLGHQSSNAGIVNPIKGMLAAAPAAIALGILVKDNGYADVFQGLSAEEIVQHGTSGIKGEANKKIVQAILDMENLPDAYKAEAMKMAYGQEMKAEKDAEKDAKKDNDSKHLPDELQVKAMEVAYGQATGKKVNERELIAAYELAKKANEQYAQLDIQPTPPVEPDPEPTPVPTPVPTPDPEPTPVPTPVPTPEPEPVQLCEYEVCSEEGTEPKSYTIKYGNYPSGIIMDMYGVKYGTPEYRQIRDAVYEASGYKRNTNLKVGDKFTLPDVKVGDKVYSANVENDVRTGDVVNNGLKLGRTNKVVKSGDKYYIQDCKGNIKMDEKINGSTNLEEVQARVNELNAELEAQALKQNK